MAEQRTPDSPPYQFDAEAFHKELDKAQNVAEGVLDPIKTPAVQRKQAGVDVLVGRCPKCKTIFGLSGEGKHLCRSCFAWLAVERAG